MNHRPIVVNPTAEYLSENYGIGEARRDFLLNELTELGRSMRGVSVQLHVMIDDIASFTVNQEEFTWCVTVQMAWLVKNNFALL